MAIRDYPEQTCYEVVDRTGGAQTKSENAKDFADSTVAKVRTFTLRHGPNLAKRWKAVSSERRKE